MLTPTAVGSTGDVLVVLATIICVQRTSIGMLHMNGVTGCGNLNVETDLHAMNVKRDVLNPNSARVTKLWFGQGQFHFTI